MYKVLSAVFLRFVFHSYSPHVLIYYLITMAMNIKRAFRGHFFTTVTKFCQLFTIPAWHWWIISFTSICIVDTSITYLPRLVNVVKERPFTRSSICNMYCGGVSSLIRKSMVNTWALIHTLGDVKSLVSRYIEGYNFLSIRGP